MFGNRMSGLKWKISGCSQERIVHNVHRETLTNWSPSYCHKLDLSAEMQCVIRGVKGWSCEVVEEDVVGQKESELGINLTSLL